MKSVAWPLTVVLAGFLNQLHAAELQINITGQGCVLPAAASCGPYTISFDVDTLSGHQQQGLATVNGVSYVVGFDSGPLALTNFQESFGGHFAYVRSTTGALSFSALPGVSDLALDTQNFLWDSANPEQPLPQLQFTLANYLLGLSGDSFGVDGALEAGLAVNQDVGLENGTIRVTAVPEPGFLALVLAGFAGAWLTNGRRRTP